MDSGRAFQPRVSRETRLLLTTAVLATVALAVLARIQPADVTSPAALVAPVLSPFSAPADFDRLADAIARTERRVAGLLVRVPARGARGDDTAAVGLRLGPNLVLTVPPRGAQLVPGALTPIASDPASQVTLLEAEVPSRAGLPVPWIPPATQAGRYFIVTDLAGPGLAVRPVFLSPFVPRRTALAAETWALHAAEPIAQGAVLFTTDGELVGLVVDDDGDAVVLPAAAAAEFATWLRSRRTQQPGRLDIEVQPLTSPLQRATGSPRGVVVARATADSGLEPGDVIERWNERPVESPREWAIHAARAVAGETVRLSVRRGGALRDMALAVPASSASATVVEPDADPLGLRLRTRRGLGSEVMAVAPGSASDRAGFLPGDLITRAAAAQAPSPQQIAAAFRTASTAPVLVAVRRGASHLVLALER